MWTDSVIDTNAAAPPPTPLNIATSWGIAVIFTNRATGTATTVPMKMPSKMSPTWCNGCPSTYLKNVATMATFFKYVDGHPLHHVGLILLGIFIGTVVAVPVARFVKMTAMPQLVAIFNGVGGGAAALVSITEFVHIKSTHPATYVTLEVLLGVLIGTVSFSGSSIAFAKLQELMTGRPVTYPGQQIINAVIGAGALALIVTIL